jgi:DNA (cytosine-5)-methyltransferase 3A
MTGLRVISLFDGMSCGQLAFEKADIKIEKYLAAEIDKYAIETTMRNFKKTKQLGNVFEIDYKKIGKQDILIGGSPCTFWSISKRERETTSEGFGFDLFKQYLRGLEETKPEYFIYENNFSIHKNIQEEITRYLGVKPIMIDSALFTGQKRKRLYWTKIKDIRIPEIKQPPPKGGGFLGKDNLGCLITRLYG